MSAVLIADIEPDSRDSGAVAHYGDPMREQRTLATAAGLVDRSHRGVIAVPGPERLTWLHSLTTQHLTTLAPGQGTELLVLSPHGHVEHHALVAEDGTTTWLDTEPDRAGPLLDFLTKMRFLTRVEPAEVTADWGLLSLVGPAAADALAGLGPVSGAVAGLGSALAGLAPPEVAPVPGPKFASVDVPGRPTTLYSVASLPGGGWARRMGYGYDLLVPRASVPEWSERLDVPWVGVWAFEALRVADRRPRYGLETDHRTIPAEVGWLADAVHVDKGCYRGQETVARVHNLGRPPRRLVLLHLDGISTDTLPEPGTKVSTVDGREIGFVGTAVRHHELGMIALALVKRSVPDTEPLRVAESAAAIDPATDPA
ncbi:MAG: folate-binding protein YgfZ [Actinobacteria bacterium 13_2_20CM_2_71_6]|nr:MAG: folate-binding protein YgfZ [Actinobacteria bacterium 13_2_20CM_2_71_6]